MKAKLGRETDKGSSIKHVVRAAMLCLILTNTLLPVSAQQQSPPAVNNSDGAANAPLIVAKFAWSKERIGWERDPFGGAVENNDERRVRDAAERRVNEAKRRGDRIEQSRAEADARAEADYIARQRNRTPPPRYVFLYRATVKNTHTQPIREIDWDYVFYDAATQQEIGRHQFTSQTKIGAGKNKELSFTIPQPPARTVSVYALNDSERRSLREQVFIMRVLYADGTTWQPAPVSGNAARTGGK